MGICCNRGRHFRDGGAHENFVTGEWLVRVAFCRRVKILRGKTAMDGDLRARALSRSYRGNWTATCNMPRMLGSSPR